MFFEQFVDWSFQSFSHYLVTGSCVFVIISVGLILGLLIARENVDWEILVTQGPLAFVAWAGFWPFALAGGSVFILFATPLCVFIGLRWIAKKVNACFS